VNKLPLCYIKFEVLCALSATDTDGPIVFTDTTNLGHSEDTIAPFFKFKMMRMNAGFSGMKGANAHTASNSMTA
jgi:hypothetical protein